MGNGLQVGEAMADAYRLYVELPNGARFRAQGDVSEVRVDLDRFYELLLTAPKPAGREQRGEAALVDESGAADTMKDAAEQQRPLLPDGLEPALLERLFSKDRNGTVSLRALPHGDNAEADALLALIYGAAKLAGEPQVTGSRLKKAAAQSGLHQVDRIDRSLANQIGQYVTAAGFKKGRRYGLTNPGTRRAEEILAGILG